MMVVRAFFAVGNIEAAGVLSRQLCTILDAWGECKVLKLEPDYRDPSQFVEYVNVAADRSCDPVGLVRDVAHALNPGEWEVHEDDPDEAWAVWDGRTGGKPTLGSMTWACIELLPPDQRGSAVRTGEGPSVLHPPQE